MAFLGAEELPDEDSDSSALLPLLVETNHPQQWCQRLRDAANRRSTCLLSPARQLEAAAGTTLAELNGNVVTLMSSDIPSDDRYAHALAMDVSRGPVNGEERPLLHKFKGPHLATGIRSHEAHRQCREAGFHWFEGSWPLYPEPGQVSHSATSRGTLLRLLGLVASDADSHEIEVLLKRDPNLSYQLLKLVNSVSFSLTHKIASFNQAITLLGRRQLQRWLQLLLYAGHHANGTVSALFGFAACRAKLIETLVEARGGGPGERDCAFMVGMFSLLDVLFDTAIADLVLPLNLSDELARAIIGHEGTWGQLLDLAIAAETVPGESFARGLTELSIAPEVFARAQLHAATWAAQVCRELA